MIERLILDGHISEEMFIVGFGIFSAACFAISLTVLVAEALQGTATCLSATLAQAQSAQTVCQ